VTAYRAERSTMGPAERSAETDGLADDANATKTLRYLRDPSLRRASVAIRSFRPADGYSPAVPDTFAATASQTLTPDQSPFARRSSAFSRAAFAAPVEPRRERSILA